MTFSAPAPTGERLAVVYLLAANLHHPIVKGASLVCVVREVN